MTACQLCKREAWTGKATTIPEDRHTEDSAFTATGAENDICRNRTAEQGVAIAELEK